MALTPDDIEQLRTYLRGCIKQDGPYTLSSGRQANYYYDGKGATQYGPAAWLIGNALLDLTLESGAEAVGGLEIGSIPIGDAVAIAAHVTRGVALPTFIVRKAAKGHGTRSRLSEANMPDGSPLLREGRRVAVVDDVITTGGSIQQAIDVVREVGCIVTVVLSIVERHESAELAQGLRGQGFPVKRLYYTDEQGELFVDEDFAKRATTATGSPLLSR